MIGVNVDINIRDNSTGAYVRIPVIPELISYDGGEALATSVNVINLGTVDFPKGKDLDNVQWTSFFPARYDAAYCKYSNIRTPIEYANIIEQWKAAGTSLQLIIPAMSINKKVYVKGFTWNYGGFEGDIYYNLTLRELKDVRPVQIATAAATVSRNANTTAAARVPVTTKPPTSYTVKPGDNLTVIAKKLSIANWRTLYEKNKAVIGSNPNVIKPGQVLIV